MTNILYGVHGIGHGHTIRALTIANAFPQHNFLFISDQNGYNLLRPERNVLKVPSNGSPALNHTMPYCAAISTYFNNRLHIRLNREEILKTISSFQPDLAITDFESNIPWISRLTGLTCLSLDHQHIALLKYPFLSLKKSLGLFMLRIAIWVQFHEIQNRMIISFFNTACKTGEQSKVYPPLLRQKVLDRISSSGDHVLAYHGYPTTNEFHQFLLSLPCPVICYGTNVNRVERNVTYKKNSSDSFLDDIASCRFVVSTAGHTLLSEALYFGKPIMAFPIRYAYEQFLNAYFIERNGYGVMNSAFAPSAEKLHQFEKNIDHYRENIQAVSFCGNTSILSALDSFFTTKKYTPWSSG